MIVAGSGRFTDAAGAGLMIVASFWVDFMIQARK
jgi:hypothetical protein